MQLSKVIYLISILLVYCTSVKSQLPPDFTDLSDNHVKATYGNGKDPFEYTGLHPNRHVLITSPGTDNYTNGKLSLLPANTSKVIRLGEARNGQSESISYRFVVDPEKTLLKVQMAIVAYNSKIGNLFGGSDNSDFIIQTKSISGQKEYACANFSLKSLSFHLWQTPFPNSTIKWKDWSDIILDLTPFSGQEVEIS
ncbi:MAG: hypothetical protein K2L23_07790, partial [Odoribacter sp.]|nr:hypothetical protein [Odoribacter sp.]